MTEAVAHGCSTVLAPTGGFEALRQHAERTYPNECCGILVGRFRERVAVVEKVVPTRNESLERSDRRYEIAPTDLLKVMRDAAGSASEVVGYYHSHPDGLATPSSTDQQSAWPGVSYIIVAVKSGRAMEVRSWTFDDGKAIEQTIVGDDFVVRQQVES
jgi:proteasome lid subunit RPN8/RPN11